MSNDDMNKLIEEALSACPASDSFKEHLLQDSTTTFTRSRTLQRRLRMTGFTIVILLFAATAFFCGRLSIFSQMTNRQVAVRTVREDNDGIRVSKDLVAWLDAARFFTRLGMNERAALSYKQASDLVPYDALFESQQAGNRAKNVWAAASDNLSITGSHLQDTIDRSYSAAVLNNHKRGSGLPHEILSQITAQHFWRSEP